jgi:hypothetical protein
MTKKMMKSSVRQDISQSKSQFSRTGGSKNPCMTFYFDTELCKSCFTEDCYSNTKEKTLSISIKSEKHPHQMAYLESEAHQNRKGFRSRIKNTDLKNANGMSKAKYRSQFRFLYKRFLRHSS